VKGNQLQEAASLNKHKMPWTTVQIAGNSKLLDIDRLFSAITST